MITLTDILSRTLLKLSQIIVQILDTAFLSPPLGGLRNNVRCSSWAHWKARMDFLLVLIKLFSLGVTAELLRRKEIESRGRFRSNAVGLIQNFR